MQGDCMNDKDIKKLKEEHFNSYKEAVLTNIVNNSNVLFDEDIMSLIKKPPLDSMDLIKSRFLSVAKKNKIIIENDSFNKYLDNYRKDVISLFDKFKKNRISSLSSDIKKTKFKEDETIKLLKKDFNAYNKKMKKEFKDNVVIFLDKNIIKNIDHIFKNKDIDNYDKVKKDMIKYLKNNYLKQLLENVDIKVLVKDAMLMNNVREQGERYLFTLSNSRLFD